MRRFGPVALASLALLGIRCSDPQTFVETQKHTVLFVDIRNVVVLGQSQEVFSVTVPGDGAHPHFEGRWTVRDQERPIDAYVFRAEDYDSNQPPAAQTYFWASTRQGLGVGQQRSNEVHVHPTPGNWVLVFQNPGLNAQANRTELSAEIALSYFK